MRAAIIGVFLGITLLASGQNAGAGSATQARPASPPDIAPGIAPGVAPNVPPDMGKYAPVLNAFGQLFQSLKDNVQFPPERTQSHLLPLLPESTVFYFALPNYGETSHQAMSLFHQELAQNPDLKKFWEQGPIAAQTPKFEEYLDKYYQLSEYLGDEMVLSAAVAGDQKEPSVFLLAELRKPGAKAFLEQSAKELSGKSAASVRVLDPRELDAVNAPQHEQKLTLLVRPDFLVAALDVETLRRFSAELDRNQKQFASTPFGQRIEQAYEGGATAIGAIDLQKILALLSKGTDKNAMALQRSGFADMKYLVWRHKSMAGRASSEAELSFTAPRHGVASWLAAPGPMGSLDFVSPGASLVVSARLKSPAAIFDDIKDLATASNPNAIAAVPAMEQALHLSLRDDLLGQLSGEFAVELENASLPNPEWRAIFRVNDAERLQAALNKVLALQHIGMQQFEQDGIIFHDLQLPSGQKTNEFSYAFVDGYLVAASSRAAVSEAIRAHHSGGSLAKSSKFLESLPPAPRREVSALIYEDAAAMTAFNLRRAAPELASIFSKAPAEKSAVLMCAYGEESALREASMSQGVDVGAVLAVAAIAMPNLMRARNTANDSSAVASIRTVNAAQVTYSATYPDRGFARDLASLGPDPEGVNKTSAEHAGLIDKSLGDSECTAGKWYTKSGFRFTIKALCLAQQCTEYAVLATPVDSAAGTRNFCSTSNAVIRVQAGPPLTVPISASECRKWARLPQ